MAVRFDLSGVSVRLRGLDAGLAARFAERWGNYETRDDTSRPDLDVEVVAHDDELDDVPFGEGWKRGATSRGGMRFSMHEGEIEVDPDGKARAVIRRGDVRRRFGALANLVCAALAWTLPARPCVVLHGAGIVVGESGFVLVGPEGSGKTTWVELAREAGAMILSDDLVVIDGARERPDLLMTPFRDEQAGRSAPGRFRLDAILFPAHGRPARLETVSGLRARVKVLANLPFISEDLADDDRLADAVESILARVPCRTLTFDREPSFVDLLRERDGGT
jgi:hypothetical protein